MDDLNTELLIIDELIHSKKVEIRRGGFNSEAGTIEDFTDVVIPSWKGRGVSVSCGDLRRRLKINYIVRDSSVQTDDAITYLEYVMNILKLFYNRYFGLLVNEDNFSLATGNCTKLIESLSLQSIIDEENDILLLVPKNASAIAVAEKEILSTSTSVLLLKYHHHLLKGNMQQKRDILLALGDGFEPIRNVLKSSNQANLESDISFCLNKLNIRHNNMEGKNAFPPAISMSVSELEDWYDRTYDLLLLGFIYLEYLTTSRELIQQLKT